ncbi:hypothetical protein [uncultured virus]|uniref:Uncharacterized protein n=1 Tax=uncultured virus TaxID=340016 RepID=A0A218MMQ0_9VIRU|nr:hypothetical protein [uncultured virus]
MGYLDNSSITVDAILTKKGRELLARNDGSFQITQFALGDDEIDYTLFNENHPNGTQYAAEAIENMPLIEAIPDGSNMMKSQLITLTRGQLFLPHIQVEGPTNDTITLTKGSSIPTLLQPVTHNMSGNTTDSGQEPAGYKFTIVNFLYLNDISSPDSGDVGNIAELAAYGGDVATAESVTGKTVSLLPTNEEALFPANITSLTTTLIIEGMTTGARKTIQVIINKT